MKIEKLSNNKVKYTLKVTEDEFNIALDYAFDRVKGDVEIKGFRKGHVPRNVYEQKFGVESLYEHALNHVFQSKYHEVIADNTYEIVGEPKPDVNIADVGVGKEFEVSLEAAIKPEVELGEYKGIEVEKLTVEVTKEEIDSQIDAMLNQNVVLEPKEEGSLEKGDTAIFDFEGFVDEVAFDGGKAENYELEIGSGQFIPGFEDQMVGMNPGEEKDVNVTFPEQYQEASLQGKDAIFKVKLHEIKVKQVNELTDEWVASLGNDEKTVDELKAKLQSDLKKQKENENKNISINSALNKLAESSKVDIPVEMIDHETNQALRNIEQQAQQYGMDFQTYVQLTGMTEENLRAQVQKDSELKVLNSLLIEAVANKEAYEVTKEQLEAKYEEIATMYQMPVEEVKQHLTDDLIERDIKFAQALDTIYDNLKYV